MTSASVRGDGWHRNGTAIAQKFRCTEKGKVVKVVNVHAGHNGTPGHVHWRSALGAKKDILKLKRRSGNADVTLVGGDFNEMTELVGKGVVGEGVRHESTHSMGPNDKAGCEGHSMLSAFSWPQRGFGSDHYAVKIKPR